MLDLRMFKGKKPQPADLPEEEKDAIKKKKKRKKIKPQQLNLPHLKTQS